MIDLFVLKNSLSDGIEDMENKLKNNKNKDVTGAAMSLFLSSIFYAQIATAERIDELIKLIQKQKETLENISYKTVRE